MPLMMKRSSLWSAMTEISSERDSGVVASQTIFYAQSFRYFIGEIDSSPTIRWSRGGGVFYLFPFLLIFFCFSSVIGGSFLYTPSGLGRVDGHRNAPAC